MVIDLYWTLDGDYSIDPSGDLRDTSFDPLRSYFQEMRTRARSELGDWSLHPSLGADLGSLIGRPNNRLTAEEGRERIISAMVYAGFLRKEILKVRYVPVSEHQLVYFIDAKIIMPNATKSRYIKVQLLFDTEEHSLRVIG